MSGFEYNIKLVAFDLIFFNVIFLFKKSIRLLFYKNKTNYVNRILNMIFFTKIKTSHLRLNILQFYFYLNKI